jgi:branched-chain amino acid transport system ATP-binding protein
MSKPLLTVSEIHTYYGDSYVLQGVSLTLREGQIAAILGRNSMGKTTLIRSVAGLTPPRTGDIIYRDRSLRGLPPTPSRKLALPSCRRAGESFARSACARTC